MKNEKTHTGIIITKNGEETVKLSESPTTWRAGRNETYSKETGRRCGAPLTSRRLKLASIKPIEKVAAECPEPKQSAATMPGA